MRRAAALAVALAAAFIISPVAASPQPSPACPICESVLERSASSVDGSGIDVVTSTATVQLHRNGSASWHVVNELSPSAPASTNGSFQWYVDDRRYTSGSEPRDDLDNAPPSDFARELLESSTQSETVGVSARASDDRFVVDFRTPNASTRIWNVILWKHVRRVGTWPRLGQTTLTVHPPAGWVVTNDPDATSANASHVTWVGDSLEEGLYVAAMPSDASAQGVRTGAAIAVDHTSRLQLLLPSSAIPATVAAGLVVGFLVGVRASGLTDKEGARTIPAALLTLVVLGALAVVFLFSVSITLLAIIVLLLGGLGFGYLVVRRNPGPDQGAHWRRFVSHLDGLNLPSDPHQTAAWAVAGTALVGCWTVLEGLRTLLGAHPGLGGRIALGLLLAPLAVAFPLGMALGRRERTVGDRVLAVGGYWLAALGGTVASYGPDLQPEAFAFLATAGYVAVITVFGISVGTLGVLAGRTWVPTDRKGTGTTSATERSEDRASS